MKFLLTLDYELFFGNSTGTVDKCLIEPINALLDVISPYGIKLTLFVDSGFLVRASEEANQYNSLKIDLGKVKKHLNKMHTLGHDVQLHIHPHWQDCHFNDNQWHINTNRYKLHDFDSSEIKQIVHSQKHALTEVVGNNVFAYRAGGWCIQPFKVVSEALWQEGIWIDSTVFYAGKSDHPSRGYDFSSAPNKAYWRFEDDPQSEEPSGRFMEIAISSCRVPATFFWRMALSKIIFGSQHQPFGDGSSMTQNFSYYLKRLAIPSHSVVSIDGLKAGFLKQAFQQNLERGNQEIFNVMGHPKSLTPYSLNKLKYFLASSKQLEPITFQDLAYLNPK